MDDVTLPPAETLSAVEILGPQDLEQVLALQNAVRAALPEGQKMFVLPQPDGYFQSFLGRTNGIMVGLRNETGLVAQAVVMGPMTLEEAIDRNAITRSDVAFHHAAPSESIVVVKSMAVHPKMQGNGLAQQLLQAALAQPLARVADHVFAQISVENTRSWELFLRCGFGIVAAALDPKDNQPRFVLQKPALGFSLHTIPSVDDVDPIKDFPSVMRVTQREELIGRFQEAGLAFYARSEVAASWYDKAALTGQ